jgi:hypothetical protein
MLQGNNHSMMKRLLILLPFSFFLLLSCTHTVKDWSGGSITKPGNYIYKDSLVLQVEIENSLVEFKMTDVAGNEIVRNKYDFSDFHKWALYLDKDKSLWVFSSDIGDGLWKRNPETNQYTYIGFDHHLTRGEVPKDLYTDLEEFF